MNVNLVFLLLVAIHGALCRHADVSGSLQKKSIVNGYDAIRDYKFYVRVWGCDKPDSDNCLMCGGSLITDTTVLTAAHCITDQYPYMEVEAADYTELYSSGELIRARDTKVHSRWNPNNIENGYDIGLLYLEQKPPNRSPIRLCEHSGYGMYHKINVIGMGDDEPSNEYFQFGPLVMQQRRVREIRCPNAEYIDESIQVCLNGDDTSDYGSTCNGDSGGPAFPEISNTCLYGIVSYGAHEECDSWSAYTRVPAFIDWIEQNA